MTVDTDARRKQNRDRMRELRRDPAFKRKENRANAERKRKRYADDEAYRESRKRDARESATNKRRADGVPSRGPGVCAREGCGKTWDDGLPSKRYCSPSCRSMDSRRRTQGPPGPVGRPRKDTE